MRVLMLDAECLDSAVVKSLACHRWDPGSIPGVGMWQGNGHLSKAGGFPRGILFFPPRITTAGRDSSVVVMPLGMQEAPRSIPASSTFFREDLVMKIFLRPFLLFR